MSPEWFKKVTYHALADTETCEATYDLSRQLCERQVEGDFVECGVFAGAQVAMMARACLDAGSIRRFHLFDSFAGIPLAGENDDELKGNPAGISACSLEQVMANMQAWNIPNELLVYHVGLFEETVPKADIPKIAFLRLDGDLYTSTKVCLEHFQPKVVRGGWVCIDDFNLSGCRKATLECLIPAPVYWRVPTK